MSHGWEGEKVRLVPLDHEKHLDNALKWFNDPEITQWLETGDWPLTRGAEEEFFRAAERQDQASTTFGFRDFRREGRMFVVNGRPTLLRGHGDSWAASLAASLGSPFNAETTSTQSRADRW